MKKILLILCSFFSFSVLAFDGHYSLDHRIPLQGGEGWDYLSLNLDRLFVTRGNHVDVVDLKTEKIIGTISQFIDGAHAVVFAPGLKKGYITSGKSAKVVVFDLLSLKVLKEIPAGKKADAMVYHEKTARLFSFNGEDKSITVIDAKKESVLKTIALDGKPEFAVTDGEGNIYFNNEDKNTLQVLDPFKMELVKSWQLSGCQSPTGLSADFKSHRLFSVCANEVMVASDADQGKIIKTIPIGKGTDGSAFDDGLVFSSNGVGTLTVVQEKNPNEFLVLENVETQKGARTMTVDPKTHIAYLIAAKYEGSDSKVSKTIPKIIPGSVEVLVVKRH